MWPPLFIELAHESFSGVVSLDSDAVVRNFYFYFGEVLACSKASGGEAELSAIYSKRSTVSREIAAGLMSAEGEVKVTPKDFEGDEFSIGIERRVDIWAAMLKGIKDSPMLGSVGADEARRLSLELTPTGREALDGAGEGDNLDVPSDALWLLKEISEPITLSRLRTRAGVGENIRGLIWLLKSLGFIKSSTVDDGGTIGSDTSEVPVPTPVSSLAEAPSVKAKKAQPPALNMELPEPVERRVRPDVEELGERPSDPTEGLRWEYNARMGYDFYHFLGMDQSSSAIELVVECRKVMQRLHSAQRSDSLPDDVVLIVSDLLSALTKVFSTFSDQRRKELYDQSLAIGEAVILEKRQDLVAGKTKEVSSSQERARSFTPPDSNKEGWGFWKKDKK